MERRDIRIGALIVLIAMACLIGNRARADEKPTTRAILDKAVKALGGEETLSKVRAATWKAKGIIRFADKDRPFTSAVAVQGLDHYREDLLSEFMDIKVKATLVLYGDQGYRHFGAVDTELDASGIANLKRTVSLVVIPITIVPLRAEGYKLQTLADEKIGDQLAAGIKATGSDGKEFRIYFDKKTGVPVKIVAHLLTIEGSEFDCETTYGNYKDFGRIKKATKVMVKRDGHKFLDQEITEFKIVDKLDKEAFLKPE
jgi:hypothetical protein